MRIKCPYCGFVFRRSKEKWDTGYRFRCNYCHKYCQRDSENGDELDSKSKIVLAIKLDPPVRSESYAVHDFERLRRTGDIKVFFEEVSSNCRWLGRYGSRNRLTYTNKLIELFQSNLSSVNCLDCYHRFKCFTRRGNDGAED